MAASFDGRFFCLQERIFGTCEHHGCDRHDLPPTAETHKNPSMFVADDELLFLDWISPMEVGRCVPALDRAISG